MTTIPTPPTEKPRRDAPSYKPRHNETPPKHERHGMKEKQTPGRYTSPRYGDPVAHVGVQIVAAELKMGYALLAKVNADAMQEMAQARNTLEAKTE